MFHCVRFPFKRNRTIRLIRISQPEKMIIIFCHISNIKENDQQFQLLSQMDLFVVDENFIPFIFGIFNENKREQRNAVYFCIFEKLLAHNYHITNIKFWFNLWQILTSKNMKTFTTTSRATRFLRKNFISKEDIAVKAAVDIARTDMIKRQIHS